MINHRQSSTAFACFLSEENNLAFGVHRPMLPSSIKIVGKLVELTEQNLLIVAVTASIPGNVTKKVKLLPRPSHTIRAKEKEKENEGLGTRD